MAIYGITVYSTDVYGYNFPPDYRVEPFTAASHDYSTIALSWVKPAGEILAYRLIRNRYGYPVDEDDGEILFDSVDYPGSQFMDHTVIPGEYHYYGFYVLLDFLGNVWVRSGLTACLAIKNFNQYQFMYDLIPGYFVNAINDGDELSADAVGDPFLQQYMQVIGWFGDQIKTQYDTYTHINDPWKIPLSDLYNLGNQMGININPDIHPYTLRKAIYFNAIVNQLRGTLGGIETEVSALTGWNLDLRIGSNMMLENDQSNFSDPDYSLWSPDLNYALGERVTFVGATNTYFYQCINATANIGQAPTGTTSSNTWWQAVLGVADNTVLLNAATGNPDTWEVIFPAQTNGAPPANSIQEVLGVINPLLSTDFTHNSLEAINTEGTSQVMWLRSVSRTIADMSTVTTTFAVDNEQAINDGIPIPYSLPSQVWNAETIYFTDDIVTYSSQPFKALRRSVGAVPPYATIGSVSAEWEPIAWEPRYRLFLGGYALGSTSHSVTPFVEWYDSQGNYITRVVARSASSGTVSTPNALYYDSFTTGAGGNISTRTTDDGNGTWVQQTGTFALSPFATGCIYPKTVGQRTYSLINSGVSDTQVGVTFLTEPSGGQSMGILFRWTDDNDYFRADYTTLRVKNAGSFSTLGTFSSAFVAGDRMVVQLSGTSIIVLKNGVSVLSTTSSFNQTATYHGIIVENT